MYMMPTLLDTVVPNARTKCGPYQTVFAQAIVITQLRNPLAAAFMHFSGREILLPHPSSLQILPAQFQ